MVEFLKNIDEITKRINMPKIHWSDVKEYFSLLGLNLLVKWRNAIEYAKVIYRFYRKPSFAKVDLSVILMYFFDNPFSVSKRFFLHHAHKEEFTYGETPLTTFATIAKEARITSADTVYELGCGRGRVCFWLNKFIGCKVTAVDLVDDFIVRAKRIQRKLGIYGVEFRDENFLHTNVEDASVVYLYGTCLEDATIRKLVKHFKSLPTGARVITVSYALSDYTDDKVFETMKRFPASFTWGEGDVYIQVKK